MGKRPMKRLTLFLCFVAILSFASAPRAQTVPDVEQVKQKVQNLPDRHPRLFLTQDALRSIKNSRSEKGIHKTVLNRTIEQANHVLERDPVEREKRGKRLLHVSRKVLTRVTRLALAYRVTERERYLDRAVTELIAAARFDDWNPSHFLDVAEMTAALGLGYDWLYQDLTTDQRATIRNAIIEKGLKPGMKGGWWVDTTNNWNQVCHGGLTIGALAIAKHNPELASRIISRAVRKVPRAMKQYSPDGAYPEGPSYWGYGTTYNVLFLSALESVFDTDYGLSEIEGFMDAARYYLHVHGPTGYSFNYSDASRHPNLSPAVLWFAKKQQAPELAYWFLPRLKQGKTGGRYTPLVLFWGSSIPKNVPAPEQNHWSGRGKTPVGFHRTGWTNDDAYVAIKGGSPSTNHAHMDIGTFVYEANGVRWATDLGKQSYHDLESAGVELWNSSQDSERWNVFRLNNFSHNTLVVNDRKQRVNGHAPITSFTSSFPRAHTVVNMSSVYGDQLEQAHRGVTLFKNGSALVQDELVTPNRKTTVRWGMVTRAEVDIRSSKRALLEKGGESISVRVLSPESAELEIYDTANPPREYDASNEGTRMIGFQLTLPPDSESTLSVQLKPEEEIETQEPLPLSEW